MRAYLYDVNETEWQLPLLFEWDVCHGMGESCDFFEISFPFEKSMTDMLAAAVRFKGVNNGETVFTGVVDEYCIQCDGEGSRVTVSGRSMAALLMDNEAEAACYTSLSLPTVMAEHVVPWWTGRVERPEATRLNNFTVNSGESEWSVLSRFCRFACGTRPRFSRDGVLVLNDKTGNTVTVDESYPVFSVKKRDCRYGVISSVLVKNNETHARYTVHNEAFEARGGMCRRVLTVPKTEGADAMRFTGEYQITESQREKSTVEIGLSSQFAAFPGDIAEVNLPSVGITGSFRVIKSRCWADDDDAGTYITLEV